jgi:spectinomycin phosphotransferase
MREPPRLAEEAIGAALRAHYDIAVVALAFLPIGADAASSVYRVEAADGARYLLKLRTGAGFRLPSLAIPQYFHAQGVPHIVAPIPTTSQELWVGVSDFALSLYPLLDARTGTEVGLSDQQWRSLGTTLKRIHTAELPPGLLRIVPRETFTPSRRDVLTRLAAVITRRSFADPLERELAAFWHARRDEIRTVVERADTLGRRLRRAALPQVLCHADLHTWNVLVGTARQLWIVDWDETILAPKERDLMFVIGGIGRDLVGPQATARFLRGYGDTAIDPDALVYYRYAWAVQDMGAYAEEVFFSPDLGEQTRRDAVQSFMRMFEPGNIVAIARADDHAAPPTG